MNLTSLSSSNINRNVDPLIRKKSIGWSSFLFDFDDKRRVIPFPYHGHWKRKMETEVGEVVNQEI